MQKIVQEELQREVPYVHCFNHHLHLVVVHAMSSDFTLELFQCMQLTLQVFQETYSGCSVHRREVEEVAW